MTDHDKGDHDPAADAVDVRELSRKIDALGIIFAAPLWPKWEELGEAGKELFDRLVEDAKPYALAIVDGAFPIAHGIAATWSLHLNNFLDNERIEDSPHRARMVAVYKYYCDQSADFSKIKDHMQRKR